jgi:FeS assembly SUF system protein
MTNQSDQTKTDNIAHQLRASMGPADPLRDQIAKALKTVYDPEIPVDIFELGLIYVVDVSPTMDVAIKMTLTSPNCPSAEQLPADVQKKVKTVPGINDVKVDVVWEPTWSKDMISEPAMLELGFE